MLLVLGVIGCGTRQIPAATESGTLISPSVDGRATPDGLLPLPPTGAVLPDCVVAQKLDACCASPRPVAKAALAKDPCLVPYPYHATPPAGCKPPSSCGEIACDWAPPLSRLAQPLPDGSCTWKSECQVDSDCAMALAWNICGCNCVQSVPRPLLDPKNCVTEPQSSGPTGCSPICDTMAPPCSSGCVATNWIRAFCDGSKLGGSYRVCNLVGAK